MIYFFILFVLFQHFQRGEDLSAAPAVDNSQFTARSAEHQYVGIFVYLCYTRYNAAHFNMNR